MKTIKFNFPPAVAKRYVAEWAKQVDGDDKADGQMKKIMQDIQTLVEIAVEHLTPKNKQS